MARGYGTHATAFRDLTGQQFGNWTAVERGETRSTRIHWVCRCICGATRQVSGAHLVGGRSCGCGCVRPEGAENARFKHGKSNTVEHSTWMRMLDRCGNPNNPGWHNYGGRGIAVCERWAGSFEEFLADVGTRPSSRHSIDRYPEKDGDYEPSNVRWATPTQQSRNLRKNVMVDLDGEQVTLAEACERSGVKYETARYRLKMGRHWRGVL
jgi:hypothetical protein